MVVINYKKTVMNKLKYILGALLITSVYACKKDTPDEPTFNVSTAKAEYNVADSVEFKIDGYADVIGFYSGEAGSEYRYRNRLESNNGRLHLNITTQVVFASQKNNLALMYSTDFDNIYTVAGLQAATWTDITSKFTLAPDIGSTNSAVTASEDVDLSSLVVSGKPIFFAFKYVAQSSATAALGGRTWRVSAFNLTNKTPNAAVPISTVTTAGWIGIDVKNAANKWVIQSTTPFLYFAPNSTTSESEDWVITRAIFPNKVNPDKSVNIKAYREAIRNYKYKFNQPGTYTVTFVGKNGLNGNVKEIVKELTVTVK